MQLRLKIDTNYQPSPQKNTEERRRVEKRREELIRLDWTWKSGSKTECVLEMRHIRETSPSTGTQLLLEVSAERKRNDACSIMKSIIHMTGRKLCTVHLSTSIEKSVYTFSFFLQYLFFICWFISYSGMFYWLLCYYKTNWYLRHDILTGKEFNHIMIPQP